MANFVPFLAPSKDTIQGINARTGMNLPDLPYGGILSLLTGGASGLGQYALGQMLEEKVPNIIREIDPTISNGLRNAGDVMQGDLQDYKETMLDKIFGAVPQTGPVGPTGIATDSQKGWGGSVYDQDAMQAYGLNSAPDTTTIDSYLKNILGDQTPDNIDIGGGFNPGAMPSFEMPSFETPSFEMPSFNMSNIGMDFEQMPEFNQFDFQDSMPSFDYTDFDFRKGGKV